MATVRMHVIPEPAPGTRAVFASGEGFTGPLVAGSGAMKGTTHYAELFGKQTLSNGGFPSLDAYLGTVYSGIATSGMMAGMVEGVGAAGGFTVPEEFTAEALDDSLESEIVRPRARVYPMTSDVRKIAGFDTSTHASGAIYGFTATWTSETTETTEQTGKYTIIELHARKLMLLANASNELVADGTSFEDQLGTAIRQGTGFSLDTAFFTGTGGGMPRGIYKDPALITVSKETGQAAATIQYDNLTKMFARHYNPLRAVWVVNQTAIPQLLSLSKTVGTAGSLVPVLSESNGQFTMLTRPVIFTEKVPTLGTLGDIALVDFSQYAVGMRADLILDKSNGPGFKADITWWRAVLRVDGQGRWSSPLTPLNGDTLSWAVTLQAR